MVSFIVVSHGHEQDVEILFRSISRYVNFDFEIILLDNLNSGVYFSELINIYRKFDVKLISNTIGRSFSVNNNICFSLAKYDRVIFLNPDIELIDGSINELVNGWSDIVHDGLFYPKLINSDGSPQIHSKQKPKLWDQFLTMLFSVCGKSRESKYGDYWFFAAALVTNKNFFRRLGGFDEKFPMYAEDVEICDRARVNGYPVQLLPLITLKHKLGGDSKGKYLTKAVISNIYLRLKMLYNRLNGRRLNSIK
ncbi:TPA: glycosyltransferase family 2 protein [Aeromonas veronii]